MTRLLVIGSLNYDLILTHSRLPAAGETVIGASLIETPGGKGANQAIAAARAARILKSNLQVNFIGAVGRDAFGAQQLSQLEEDGVKTTGVMTFEGATGLSTIWIDQATGQNRILNAPGANLKLLPEHLNPTDLESSDLLLLQNEIAPETLERAADLAKQAGVRVMWDPAPLAPDSEPPLRPASVQWLTPNELEAAALLGRDLGPDPSQDASDLRTLGFEQVLLTLGERGVLSARAGEESTLTRAPRVQAVDTTGAGDAFSGAFAAATLAGRDHLDAVDFAVRFATSSVTRPGAQVSFPTAESSLLRSPA